MTTPLRQFEEWCRSPEAEETAAAAERCGRLLMLGMNQRFDPAVQRARSLAANGDLGDVYHAKAWWRRRAGIPHLVLIPCLIMTFMLGPIGLLFYFAIRTAKTRTLMV